MNNPQDERAAKAVPLLELLAAVPANARLVIHDPDGSHSIPVGRYCQEARAALANQRAEAAPQRDLENLRKALSVAWTYAASQLERCKISPSSEGWMVERASEDEAMIREALATYPPPARPPLKTAAQPEAVPPYYVSGPYTVGKWAGWHSVCELATGRIVHHFKPDRPEAVPQGGQYIPDGSEPTALDDCHHRLVEMTEERDHWRSLASAPPSPQPPAAQALTDAEIDKVTQAWAGAIPVPQLRLDLCRELSRAVLAKFCEVNGIGTAQPAQPKPDYCPEKLKPGGCKLHNLQCGYPACNAKPAQPEGGA